MGKHWIAQQGMFASRGNFLRTLPRFSGSKIRARVCKSEDGVVGVADFSLHVGELPTCRLKSALRLSVERHCLSGNPGHLDRSRSD